MGSDDYAEEEVGYVDKLSPPEGEASLEKLERQARGDSVVLALACAIHRPPAAPPEKSWDDAGATRFTTTGALSRITTWATPLPPARLAG